MKEVAECDAGLNVEERNLLSVAYKNVVGARRASWRIISSMEQKATEAKDVAKVNLTKEYREKVEGELKKICGDVLDVIEKHLLPHTSDPDSKVFYNKMWVWQGDGRYTLDYVLQADPLSVPPPSHPQEGGLLPIQG